MIHDQEKNSKATTVSLNEFVAKGSLMTDRSEDDNLNDKTQDLLNLSNHNAIEGRTNAQAQIISNLEHICRNILLLMGAYMMGVYQPFSFITPDGLIHLSLIVGVAWSTCILIQFMFWWVASSHSTNDSIDTEEEDWKENVRSQEQVKEESCMKFSTKNYLPSPLVTPTKSQSSLTPSITTESVERDVRGSNRKRSTKSSFKTDSSNNSSESFLKKQESILQPQNHPELENLCMIDESNMKRSYPNGEPMKIDTELFSGWMLPMFRTCDVDDCKNIRGTTRNDAVSNYFKPKQRRFELQLQIKFKKVPVEQFYFGCEMDEPLQLGMIQRAFVGATMKFIKKRNKGFIFNLCGEEEKAEGRYEKPHFTLMLETSADRFIITKAGRVAPQLGTELYEEPDAIKRRKKGIDLPEYNTEDTYTLSVWSAYVDFIQWKCLNLPGIRPFSLEGIIGNQTFRVFWYTADPDLTRHRQCDINRLLSFEFGHTKKTRMGPSAKIWMQSVGLGFDQNIFLRNCCIDPPKDLAEDTEVTDTEQFEEIAFDEEEGDLLNEDTDTMEDLGEGIYLNSGDPIILSDSTSIEAPFLTNTGGFAVLQSQTPSTIVLEKVYDRLEKKSVAETSSQSNKSFSNPTQISSLLKSGDTVMIKLIQYKQNHNSKSIRYLAIHRGRWLKWVTNDPKTYFQIFTNDSSYLRLGGPFQLRVHRKLGLHVGARKESSTTFGGRVMGLYKNRNACLPVTGTQNNYEDESFGPSLYSNRSKRSIEPLNLCASLPNNNERSNSTEKYLSHMLKDNQMKEGLKYVEAPVWLEIMHRTKRQPQRLYLVHMMKHASKVVSEETIPDSVENFNKSDNEKVGERHELHSHVRLRTGKDLKLALRLGLTVNASNVNASNRRNLHELDENADTFCFRKCAGLESDDSMPSKQETECFLPLDKSIQNGEDLDFLGSPRSGTQHNDSVCSDGALSVDGKPADDESSSSLSGISDVDSETYVSKSFPKQIDTSYHSEDERNFQRGILSTPTPSRKSDGSPVRYMRKKWDKVAKTAVMTGKGVIKSGKVVGQTITLQNSLLSTKKPRIRRNTSGYGKDHHVAVEKTLTKLGQGAVDILQSTNQIMAGELNPPDQSCRIVSHILTDLSSISESSENAANLLCSQLVPLSEFDLYFLRGGSLELGVVPMKNGDYSTIVGEFVVARCLWESHWREEACLLYESCVTFYAVLSKKPCLVISYIDIQQIRFVEVSDSVNPLRGFPLLVIETAWRCHYIAFADKESRVNFQQQLNSSIFTCPHGENTMQRDVWKAHVWQGALSEPSLSEGKGKWAKVVSSRKSKQRVVLNTRRMAFDNEAFLLNESQSAERLIGTFVENLLRQILSFQETLEERPTDFVEFLNNASRLRTLPLQNLDFSGKESFCIFVNLYHCLLQHALLLSSHGPPTKKSIEDFMRTNCYEIGGDVFSLAELEICVIRGKMSKAVHPRLPFVQAPRKSCAHLAYALGTVEPRINFVLNSPGVTSNSLKIPILTPSELDGQLSSCSAIYLREYVSVDMVKKIVTLPKICEVYRNDFGDTDVVHYCLQYLDENLQSQILACLNSGNPSIRYHNA